MYKNKISLFIVTLIFLFGHIGTILAQEITRGPYLQIGTPSSIIVKWRTDIATDSQVQYGTSLGNLNLSVNDSKVTTKHEVEIIGLSPDTKYYYSIGLTSKALAGGDDTYFFVTSPPPGTAKPTRIWILGDSGTKNDNARAVRDAYYNYTGNRHTDLWLMLGDNAYDNGSDQEYQLAVFENMYEKMLRKSVLWPTLGNHDDRTSSSPGPYPYYDIFTLPKNGEAGGMASGTEAYYSFDYSNIHFICLNSETSSLRSSNSTMWAWLNADLATNDKDWTIAFWHHPPYSKGSHDSDSESDLIQMREQALPLLEDAGVDLVLTGHSHSYERSFLIDGHYGNSNTLTNNMIIDSGDGRSGGDGAYSKATLGTASHEGSVYIVAGSSGRVKTASLDHPIMFTSLQELGSLVLDVEANRLDATFIDDNGNIRDDFTIIKGSNNIGPASQLVLISGNNQTAPVETTLPNPFIIEVRDANNQPVPGVAVTFEITYGSGSLSNSQPQVTTLNGQASTILTLGYNPGVYTVTASAPGLTGSPQTFTATATLPDTTPPSTPTNLQATAIFTSQIDLSWNASTDNVRVTGYRIYRDGTQIGSTANTNYQDTGLSPSTTYTYTVRAYDAAGNISEQSVSASATTLTNPSDTEVPSIPLNLTAITISSSQINLSWDASTDDVGVAGYKVFRDGSQIADITTTSYTNTGLSSTITYTYTVSAYDRADNESGQSSPTSAITNNLTLSSQLFEAEDMNLTSPMTVGSDVNASGSQYISPTSGTASTSPIPEGTLSFTVSQADTYYLWIRMLGPDSGSDALYVGIDTIWDRVYPSSSSNTYEWVKVETSHKSGNYSFNLTQGTHTLQIGHGEINARADALFLTNDPNKIPTTPDTAPPAPPVGLMFSM